MKVIVQQSNEEINSIGGISLIGRLYNNLKSLKKTGSMQMSKVKSGKINHSGIIKTVAGLFALDKNEYADITPFRKNSFSRDCLKLNAILSVFVVFEFTERGIDKHGVDLLIPDIEINTFGTTLPDSAALLLLAMLAFNALRLLGQLALEMENALPRQLKVLRRCLCSVLQDLIYIDCKKSQSFKFNILKIREALLMVLGV